MLPRVRSSLRLRDTVTTVFASLRRKSFKAKPSSHPRRSLGPLGCPPLLLLYVLRVVPLLLLILSWFASFARMRPAYFGQIKAEPLPPILSQCIPRSPHGILTLFAGELIKPFLTSSPTNKLGYQHVTIQFWFFDPARTFF